MPTLTQVRLKGLKSNYRVTLYTKEGTYALSVPRPRLGDLLLPVARQNPIVVKVKPPVLLPGIPKGVKPIGKAAPKVFKYVPVSKRKKGSKKDKKSGQKREVVAVAEVPKNRRNQKAALVA